MSYKNIVTEPYFSLKLVIVGLVISALALVYVSDYWSGPANIWPVRLFVLLFYAVAALAWLLDHWRPWIGRWFTIIMLVIIINLGFGWLEISGFLVLITIPTALAAILLGSLAATVTAVGETIFLLLLPKYVVVDISSASIAMTLIGIWSMVGIMLVVNRSTDQIIMSLWEHFQHAQHFLEEARDRKAELEQALADLAHAHRESGLLNERLAAMRLIAEEAQKTKAAFVAKVSHEFRTPLNMIIGLTDLLLETPEVYGDRLPPALLEDLKIVNRNCDHLSSMISDVLDLSQTQMGHLTLHRDWTDLAECIESAVEVVRPLLEKKKLDVGILIPEDLPMVYCDRTRIRQVILNLVSNAARFTEIGGITVHVAPQDRYVVVRVIDTGPGILPEDAANIFEPFCQGTSTSWHSQGGSGLGLSISKQFVDLHNGQIWLESQPGVGSTFSFKLPISPPTPPPAKPGRWVNEDWVWLERPSRPEVSQLPLKQRIIISDETGDLCPLFTHCSDEIEFVDTRNLAQTIQELQGRAAHAIVLNMAASDNPWPLIEQTRAEIPDTPIIVCSFPPHINQALEAGAIDYLIKPVTRADLREAMQVLDRPVKKLLIVDDDPDVQQLLSRMLFTDDDTLEIAMASNGKQALHELRHQSPDLMLIDVVMAGMDGWQTLELKNRDETIKDIPVIVISALDPANQPMISKVLLATMEQGLSVDKFLRCSLELSALMLQPD